MPLLPRRIVRAAGAAEREDQGDQSGGGDYFAEEVARGESAFVAISRTGGQTSHWPAMPR